MKIIFSDDQDEVKVPKEAVALLKKGLQAVAKLHKLSAETEVSVSLVSDEVIHVLNKDYRGIDRPTDVLSFALDEAEEPQEFGGPNAHLLGDIIISAETAVRQGEEYGHGLNRELVYLGVHSLLHLLGYDHMNKADKAVMRQEEEKALQLIHLSQADLDRSAGNADPDHFAVAVVDAVQEKKTKKPAIMKTEKQTKNGKGKAEKQTKKTAENEKRKEISADKPKTEKEKKKVQSKSSKEGENVMGRKKEKETDKAIQKLFKKALKTRENAYVPFSKFKVGAALLTKSGDIFTGCNVENSSFGLTVCAERVAMFNAAAAGVRPGEITMLLVAADTEDVTSPCGACRQVMAEFEIPVIVMANVRGDMRTVTLDELLPFSFKAADFA